MDSFDISHRLIAKFSKRLLFINDDPSKKAPKREREREKEAPKVHCDFSSYFQTKL
jgi:hypothetical protein